MTEYRGISTDGFEGVMLEIRTGAIDEVYANIESRITQAEYDNRVFNEVTQEFDEVPLTEDQVKAIWVEMLIPPAFDPEGDPAHKYWTAYKRLLA